jgi:hypothetical protein
MYSDNGAVARPREVQRITQLNETSDGITMPGMYTDMRDSPVEGLRRTLFGGRDDERVLVEAFQKEIQEQRDELQLLRDQDREQRGELQHLREHDREQRAEIDHLRRFAESLQTRCPSPDRQNILRMPFRADPPPPQRYSGEEGMATLGATAPPRYRSRSINPAAAQFKPEPFTGRNPYNAESWWQKLKGYLELAEVEESVYCSLLRLLLVDDAETWFNSLTSETQTDFAALEQAFKRQYILPMTNKFTMLSDLRLRVQGSNESLRSFLTEAGAKLKAMGYPREIWLDLIYPALHGSVQSLLTGFAAENGTYDSLLNDCDRIERMAKSVCPTQQAFTVNAMYVDKDSSKPDVIFQNAVVDKKLQKIEKTLAQISLNMM